MARQISLILVVEWSGKEYWGRINLKNNLIVDRAFSVEVLQRRMKKHALEQENVDVSDFRVSYDLTAFFLQHSYLNVSDIAKRSGINAGLVRQYVSGVKFPSKERVSVIQEAIRSIGKELSKTRLHTTKQKAA